MYITPPRAQQAKLSPAPPCHALDLVVNYNCPP